MQEEYGEICDILVHLAGEGETGYHLAQGVPLGPGRFRLLGEVPEGESWSYQPGATVRCIIKVVSLDPPESHWFAVEQIDH